MKIKNIFALIVVLVLVLVGLSTMTSINLSKNNIISKAVIKTVAPSGKVPVIISKEIPKEPVKEVPKTVTPKAPVVADTGKVLFNADFETGNLSQWYHSQSCPGRITVVADPLNPNNKVGKYTVGDGDIRANCVSSPTADPRAQTLSPALLENGNEYYISMNVFLPNEFPMLSSWFGLAQIYGPPWGGSPTLGLQVAADKVTLHSAVTLGAKTVHRTIWQGPLIARGKRWEKIILRVKMSTDEKTGFVELWYNGAKQTLASGNQRYYLKTLDAGRNWDGKTPNILYAQHYRSREMTLGEVSVYHDNYKIATSYEALNR